ncbi:MAG: DUF4212 domain-containing protein [Candidatus Omnitrophica bacterium]|nr:hypothetical protein [bacterium]NUN96868.1 DUF4212 domain-containing protein [Candidatus Omnitrophota bacterium]
MDYRGEDRLIRYWTANKRLISALLTVWGLVSLGLGVLLVGPLNGIKFLGVPFGFWVAQQGAIYVFVALIFIYARRMDRLDHDYHADE